MNFNTAKNQMDIIFVTTLVCAQAIKDIGAEQDPASEMWTMGSWSSLYLTIGWLQRFYSKGHLDDSREYDISINLKGNRGGSLNAIIANLESVIALLEKNDFSILWQNGIDTRPAAMDMMIKNIYSGLVEAQAMLEFEYKRWDTRNPGGQQKQQPKTENNDGTE